MFHYKPIEVSPNLWRVTCHNPSALTGPGTNSYVAKKQGKAVIFDPGPIDTAHEKALIECAGGLNAIEAVVVTHFHPDHSPLAAVLAEKARVKIYGGPTINDPYQDTSCQSDVVIGEGDKLLFDAISVQAIFTPGHVDNHFCFFVPETGCLIAGDHIMQGSTVVIIPPHGKLLEYMASLKRLLDFPITQLLPAHGEPITDAKSEVNKLLAHRQMREDIIVDVLVKERQPLSLETLTAKVYHDVDQSLWPMAQLSLNAHLIKLEHQQKATCHNEKWQWRENS